MTAHAAELRPLGLRIGSGAALLVTGAALGRILNFLGLAILGRLLAPDDFGLFALAMIFIGFFELVVNRQFELALIRLPNTTKTDIDTALALALLWALGTALVVLVLARPLSYLFEEPALAEILPWLALGLLINGFRNPSFIDYEKALIFSPSLILEVITALVLAAISVSVAFITGDYWAMVAGFLGGCLTRTVLSYLLRPTRPGLSLRHWRRFVAFGAWLSATGASGFLNRRSSALVIGSWLPTAQLGFYHVGSELSSRLTLQMHIPVQRALYPGLATLRDDRARLHRATLEAQAALMALLLPVGVGLALTSQEALRLAMGPDWTEAAIVIQLLAPVMALTMLVSCLEQVLMIEKDTRSLVLRNAIALVLGLPLLVYGALAFGFEGVVVASAAKLLFEVTLGLWIVARTLDLPTWAPLRASRRSVVASLIMVGAVWASGLPLDPGPLTFAEAARLAALKVLCGAPVYLGAHAALWFLEGRPAGIERRAVDALARMRMTLGGLLARRKS